LQTNSVVERTAYAVPRDFCRIFAEDMNGLYWFSLLLTADREKAEQCFVAGFEDCAEKNRIFKEWARSWARRAIVQNAIRVVRPAPEQAAEMPRTLPTIDRAVDVHDLPLAAVVRLKAFERFVFVMSVLERYSDQDCKTLLGCARQEVIAARARALEQVAAFAGMRIPDAMVDFRGPLKQALGMARSA
jgi:hypothetical protein